MNVVNQDSKWADTCRESALQETRISKLEQRVNSLEDMVLKMAYPKSPEKKPGKYDRKLYRADIINILRDGIYKGKEQIALELSKKGVNILLVNLQCTLGRMAEEKQIKRIGTNCFTTIGEG